MRVWFVLGAIAVALLVASSLVGVFHVGPVFSVCARNSEIPSVERGEIVEAGEAFLALLREGDAEGARNAMSAEARAVTQVSTLESAVEFAQADEGGPAAVAEVFKLFVPFGSRNGMSLCGPPSQPDLVSRHGGTNSALATFEQPLAGGERTWTIYFERDQGAWRVRHLHVDSSAINDLDGEDFRELARVQSLAGNNFNATVLYDIGALLLSRGDSFVPSEAYGLAQERGVRHSDLVGGPPYAFRLGDASFNISLVHVTVTSDGSLVLLLEQMDEPPGDRVEAIARNRVLIDAMNTHRPEWRRAFDALAAAYPTGGRSVWRTVYDRERGYLSEPDDEAETPQD